jgi:hypothetical protein
VFILGILYIIKKVAPGTIGRMGLNVEVVAMGDEIWCPFLQNFFFLRHSIEQKSLWKTNPFLPPLILWVRSVAYT